MLLKWHEQAPIPERPELTVWSSLTETEAQVLRLLARGRNCLEIGTGLGYSALVMMGAGAESVTSLDLFLPVAPGMFGFDSVPDRYAQGAQEFVYRLAMDQGFAGRLDFFKIDSQELARFDLGRYGFAFVDADHSYAACRHDLDFCASSLPAGSWLAAHDYGEEINPEVCPAVDDWCKAHGLGPPMVFDTLAVIKV